ncbi:tetratricopeptide (TPR) repeat protein [Catenulispora sp. MAP12-49]|uniref:ATP-binding protein n=1 Tax=Catenulispora sp. MAP12-49 TaxID=3156302 RepID=UPI003518161F
MTTTPFGGPDAPDGSFRSSSTMSGTAHDVVQARDVRGGVHFHYQTSLDIPRATSHTPPRQLPGTMPLFVGREPELERLRALVAGDRAKPSGGPQMALIVGAGGAGKTSLALRFAHEVRARYPDGQLFIDLRGYSPADPMPPTTALNRFIRALGIPANDIPHDLEERAELFRSLAADRALLIVLDNVGTAGQARVLLPGSGESLVLITSRGRLPSLSRFIGGTRIDLGLFDADESAALLSCAMRDQRDADGSAIAELVALCAGLPLALRIAAERAIDRPSTPLRAVIDGLRHQALLLTTDEVTDMPETSGAQQPAESVFAWSYRHLPDSAARAFRFFGLHPGVDFDQDSAAVLADASPLQAGEYLDVLTGSHLIERTASGRFQFHDLLRAFAVHAAEQQETAEARQAALRRLADFYVDAVASAASRIGSKRQQAIAWYEMEKDTVMAIVRIASAQGFDEVSWRLPVSAEPLFDAERDYEYWLEAAELGLIAVARLADPAAEAAVRNTLGAALKGIRDYRHALEQHSAAFALFEAIGDRQGTTLAANRAAVAHLLLREFPEALASLHHALDALGPDGTPTMRQFIVGNLAECHLDMGAPEEALRIAESLPPAAPPGPADDSHPAVANSVRLIRTCTELGLYDQAEQWLGAYRNLSGNMRHQTLLAHAGLRLRQGRLEEALAQYESCLAIQSVERVRGEADCFDGMGQVLRLLGNGSEGLAFHRDAEVMRRRDGDPYELAKTLCFLSEAYAELSSPPEAARASDEALTLLEPFHDRNADALRRRLVELR